MSLADVTLVFLDISCMVLVLGFSVLVQPSDGRVMDLTCLANLLPVYRLHSVERV